MHPEATMALHKEKNLGYPHWTPLDENKVKVSALS
jgi:hypothetical protein